MICESIGRETMAAWADLRTRVENLGRQELRIETLYRGAGLPQWLTQAVDGDQDVLTINFKGVPVDKTLCVIRLEDLERLVANRKGSET